MSVPIVEDYPDIAKRLADLSRQDCEPSFRLPVGVNIHLPDYNQRISRCRLCFVLDETKRRLYFLPESSDYKLGSEEGMHFIDYLLHYFPSICILNSFELRLSAEDCLRMRASLRRLP